MTEFGERIYENAYALGRENAEVMMLARRHCLHMVFTESGGRGWAEVERGLPINERQVSCPVALGGRASNLDLVVTDFYDQHCGGCQLQKPSGEVPTLGCRHTRQEGASG